MAAVLLPPTFHNSFWSQDRFRTGLTVLFDRLEQGCAEDREIISFVEYQAQSYLSLSSALSTLPPAPTLSSPTSSTTSATLSLTFSTLRSSTTSHSEVYRAAGIALRGRVVEAFRRWEEGHERRVGWAVEEFLGDGSGGGGRDREGFEEEGLIPDYERRCEELQELKRTYISKTRTAEDLEEDVRFAPLTSPSAQPIPIPRSLPLPQGPTNLNGRLSPLPASPRLARIAGHDRAASLGGASSGTMGTTGRSGLARQGTVADRINEKLRAASIEVSPNPKDSTSSPTKAQRHSLDMAFGPGKSSASGKRSALPEVPEDVLGLSFEALISVLSRFGHYLAVSDPPNPSPDQAETAPNVSGAPSSSSGTTIPAKVSRTRRGLVGPVENTFTGTELVAWLCENVKSLGEEWETGEKGGAELLRMGMVERVGFKGKGQWDPGSEAYYILKDAVLDASPFAIEALRTQYNLSKGKTNFVQPAPQLHSSPLKPTLASATSLVKSYIPSSISALAAVTGSPTTPAEAPHVRARKEAKIADERYAEAVEDLERMRLRLEERIEQGLKLWERWERERLDVVKQVLKQYEGIIANVSVGLKHGIEAMHVAVTAYKPEADMVAMIETLRTGDFRPKSHVYETLDAASFQASFGLDLRKYTGRNGKQDDVDTKVALPPALEAMLQGLQEIYPDLPHDQRRKSWIYLVDLRETHLLRDALNNAQIPVAEMLKDVKRFNAPVIAATVKLWLLELDPPVLDFSVYQSLKSMSSAEHKAEFEMAALEGLKRLAAPQIVVLDAILGHLRQLIDTTETDETNETFVKKLSLSIGRTVLRPRSDTEMTLQDRTPSRFFTELLDNYEQIFIPLVERAHAEQARSAPQRKRTKPTDHRITRRSLGSEDSQDHGRELLEQQVARQRARPSSVHRISPPAPRPLVLASEGDRSATASVPSTQAVAHISQPDAGATAVSTADTRPPDMTVPSMVDHTPIASSVPATPVSPVHGPAPTFSLGNPVAALPPSRRAGETSDTGTDEERKSTEGHDQVLSEDKATVKRVQSNEGARLVRGPRTTRGPRVAPGKPSSQTISSPISEIGSNANTFSPAHVPRQNSIKDRIAQLENQH